MTIRVEREALLMVINTSSSSSFSSSSPLSSTSSSSSCSPCIRDDDDEFVIVDSVPTIKGKNNCFYSDYLASSSYARDNDDQASLCTISTTSDSSFDSTSDISTIADHRRVSFAPQLVTDVWTRERTRVEDISNLYYSAQQTQTFRQEYRLERKVLSDLSIDPETFPVDDEELSNLVAATISTNSSSSSSSNNDRHRISRVVVLHNDKLATFFNPADQLLLPESNNNNKEEKKQQQQHQQPAYSHHQAAAESCNNLGSNFDGSDPLSSSEDFFDNDSFWSGSLTWY